MNQILKNEPKYRLKQIKEAVFDPDLRGWGEASSLPKELREKLNKEVPWMSVKENYLFESKTDGSKKAVLGFADGNIIETVLMDNAKGESTVCISTEAGCPIGCAFCQTGKMGFKRNLSKEEIIDQYRFWMHKGAKISNIVFMGMGEPLLNYENTRDAIRDILDFTQIGQNHIVVSTVGIMQQLNEILEDELWSNIRIAISLHSAKDSIRKMLVPAHYSGFFGDVINWNKQYQEKLASENRFLSLEYVLLGGVNDSKDDAENLTKFLQKVGQAKLNLILYNQTDAEFLPPKQENILKFQDLIRKAGFICTIRKSYGQDINGACGQLASQKS